MMARFLAVAILIFIVWREERSYSQEQKMNNKKIARELIKVAKYLTHTDVELVFAGDSSAFNKASYEMQKRISNLEKRHGFDSVIMRSDASGASEVAIGISGTEDKDKVIKHIVREARDLADELELRLFV
jgi:hypothetical protein